jgi:hypothetical protein
LEDISRVEEEIMRIHASAMIRKKENLPVLEELRLKRHELFQRLSDHAVKTYELIQRSDIYPNAIEQYLDFTYNPTLHTCKKPCPAIQVEQKSTETVGKKRRKLKEPEPDQVISPFNVQPDKIVFWNYETGETYKVSLNLAPVTAQLLQNLQLAAKIQAAECKRSAAQFQLLPLPQKHSFPFGDADGLVSTGSGHVCRILGDVSTGNLRRLHRARQIQDGQRNRLESPGDKHSGLPEINLLRFQPAVAFERCQKTRTWQSVLFGAASRRSQFYNRLWHLSVGKLFPRHGYSEE